MANTFKNACLAIGASRTDVYTCPAATAAVIHSIYLSNIDGTNNATVTIELYDSSVTTHFSLGTTSLIVDIVRLDAFLLITSIIIIVASFFRPKIKTTTKKVKVDNASLKAIRILVIIFTATILWFILFYSTQNINHTLFGKYRKTKGFLFRESYLKPYKIVLTKKMKSKDTIIRYFAQYKLDKYDTIFEINKQNFNRESNFYKKIRLVWQLKGPKENILMKNEEALEVAENSMYGIQNFLDPLEFYEEDVTLEEKLQKKLSKLKFTPESTDTSSDPPSGWSAGDGPPPGSGY